MGFFERLCAKVLDKLKFRHSTVVLNGKKTGLEQVPGKRVFLEQKTGSDWNRTCMLEKKACLILAASIPVRLKGPL